MILKTVMILLAKYRDYHFMLLVKLLGKYQKLSRKFVSRSGKTSGKARELFIRYLVVTLM